MGEQEPGLKPGDVLSDTYEIVGQVARGGMGWVYEAKHRRLSSRRVAIKLLRTDTHLSQREVARRFRREAEICAELSHPHIISVTDWDTTSDGRPFFVMEYLEGESLAQRMARGRLPVSDALEILAQVGAALQYAHDRSIIHRDLKPSNIFLVSTGDPKEPPFVRVLDFGISKILTAVTLETTEQKIIGSPRYMSPEQARGKNEKLTPSSDQFALATVAYEMFAGKPAFDGDTLSTVLFNIVYEEPDRLAELAPELPDYLVEVVGRGMSKDAADRYACVADFVHALDQGNITDTVIAAAPSVGRSRWWVAAVPPLVVIVVLATAWALWWPPEEPSSTEVGNETAPGALVDTAPGEHAPGVGVSPVEHAPGTGVPPVEHAPGAGASLVEHAPGASTDQTQVEETGEERLNEESGRAEDAPGEQTRASETAPPPPPPTEVRGRLEEARRLLDGGQYDGAVRLATRTIGITDTAEARRIVTLAYCGKGDLEMAKATFHKVWGTDRADVRTACRARGLDL